MALLYELDVSIERIGQLFESTSWTVRRKLVAAGSQIRPRGSRLARRPDVPRLVGLYESGLSIAEAGRLCGLSYSAARDRLLNAGTTLRPPGGANRKPPPKFVPRLVGLYESGLSIAEAGRLCGLSYGAARDRLLDAGTTLRPPGGANRKPPPKFVPPATPLPATTV
ncbi:helix-turn-helix domain-containing protein, partial [Streptomyces sp. NPDC059970]|uniref:helix-turn-helix domain-containing protein n=1 Tax=Streptomyces sp. NPDC059970 TaxID=3347019 RepID=UPI00369EBD70